MRPLCPPSQKREREENIPGSWIEGAKPQGHKHLLPRDVGSAAKSVRAWSPERQGVQAGGGRSWNTSLKALACWGSRRSAARHREAAGGGRWGRDKAQSRDPGPGTASSRTAQPLRERKAGGRTIAFWNAGTGTFVLAPERGWERTQCPVLKLPVWKEEQLHIWERLGSDPEARGAGTFLWDAGPWRQSRPGLAGAAPGRSQGPLTLPSARVFMWKMWGQEVAPNCDLEVVKSVLFSGWFLSFPPSQLHSFPCLPGVTQYFSLSLLCKKGELYLLGAFSA